ncbi:MAG TPA: SGNH/GDSL hydrolase family protein [Candidatus Saccharimonadales bacterium]
MNVNPSAIKVLCYGDSNTWGQKPDKTGRYAADVRWTGQLQKMLGDDYYVVEEGLGSRTTDLEYDRKPGRNGKTYLTPCVASHTPLDIVVIMLGTNDLKSEFGRTAEEIATAVGGLADDVRKYATTATGKSPHVIVMSPATINANAPTFAEFYTGYYDKSSMEESEKLASALQRLANTKECTFLDAAEVAEAGEDGLHLDEKSQARLAELVHQALVDL